VKVRITTVEAKRLAWPGHSMNILTRFELLIACLVYVVIVIGEVVAVIILVIMVVAVAMLLWVIDNTEIVMLVVVS